jgi:hypothetical protein
MPFTEVAKIVHLHTPELLLATEVLLFERVMLFRVGIVFAYSLPDIGDIYVAMARNSRLSKVWKQGDADSVRRDQHAGD